MAKVKTVSKQRLKFDFSFNSVPSQATVILVFLLICYWVMKPVIEMPPQRDSGCFLYIGQNWLNGLVPYKDMWDHKGPLLYLINAIGILLSGSYGVMLLQVVLTSLGFFYLFKTIGGFINKVAALLLASTGFFILFFLHQTGNQTEQWSILFQSLALYLYFKSAQSKTTSVKAWLGIGVLMACSFLLRPNQVALWVTIGMGELFLSITKKQPLKSFAIKAGYGLLGFLIPVLLFVSYFVYQHALAAFSDCLFTFNFIYVRLSDSSFWDNLVAGIKSIPYVWIILGVIAVNLLVFIIKFSEVSSNNWFWFIFSIVWLKIEMVLSVMSGSGHLHYYIQWILPIILTMCSFLRALRLILADRQNLIYGQIVSAGILFALFFYEVKPIHAKQMEDVAIYHNEYRFREKVVDRILAETEDSDYVLEWGMVDGINFMSGRKSPTKYFYTYALDTKGYTSEARITEFLNEVKAKKPKLIIDASKMERFPQIDSVNRDSFYRVKPQLKGMIPSNIGEFYNYVENNYRYEGNIGFMLMFKRKE